MNWTILRFGPRFKQGLYVLIGLVLGWGIGVAAWGEGREPVLAILLPVLLAFAPTRSVAIALGLGYLMGVERAGPAYIAGWFDQNLLIGVVIWASSCILGALAWSAGWTASPLAWRKALSSVVAWLLTLVPPVAMLAMGHTTIAWGYLLPGGAWVTFALSALAPALLIAALSHERVAAIARAGVIAALGVSLLVQSYFYTPPNTQMVADIVAVNTNWGKAEDALDVGERIQKIGLTVRNLGSENLAGALVYPESILHVYDPRLFTLLSQHVLDPAAQFNMTLVLSMDLKDNEGNLQTIATAVYPDGRSATANARQPVPIALWRPWSKSGTYLGDWTSNNILQIKEGIKARVVFCYEEYIPILSLINEVMDDHNLVLVMSNTWASKDELGPLIQSQHSQGIAKMFGRAILRADNRPQPAL